MTLRKTRVGGLSCTQVDWYISQADQHHSASLVHELRPCGLADEPPAEATGAPTLDVFSDYDPDAEMLDLEEAIGEEDDE